MEIEVAEIKWEDRLRLIERSESQPQTDFIKFPWGIVVFSILIGTGICLAIIDIARKSRRDTNTD